MRMRTFHATDMAAAMQQIRSTMGEDAIIMSTGRGPGGKGISVTAAHEVEEQAEAVPTAALVANETRPSRRAARIQPQPPAGEKIVSSLEKLRSSAKQYTYVTEESARQKAANNNDTVEMLLREHGVPGALIDHILAPVRPPYRTMLGLAKETLQTALDSTLNFSPLAFDAPECRTILIGPPGVGKTLTAAKMAAHCIWQKIRPVVITTDNARAGGVEQLSAFTTILGLELRIANTRQDLWRELRDSGSAPVLIDTAGTNPYDIEELKELKDFLKVEHLTPALVMSAAGDVREADYIARVFHALGARHLIATRTDTARHYGSLIAAAAAMDISLSHITGTPKVVGELQPATPALLTDMLVRLGIPRKTPKAEEATA